MTNEEKAIELAENISPYDIGGDNAAHYAAKDAALDAMQWKDEQFTQEKQQWIDKACEWWENEFIYPTMTQTEINWYQTMFAEFKKAMKGE